MRTFIAAAVIAACPLATPALGQDKLGWLDLFAPDMLAQRVLQTALMSLRTQVDLKYSDMVVNLRQGRVSISDVQVWPALPYDAASECQVAVDRLTVQSADIASPELLRASVQAVDIRLPLACLPPPARTVPQLAGLDAVTVPRLTLDIQYDVPSAEADVQAFAQLQDVAAFNLTADFSYLWVRTPQSTQTEPLPVAYLRSAGLRIENLGGWNVARSFLPPAFTDPAQAGPTIQAILGQGILGMTGDPELNAAQQALIGSAADAWPAFLENPQQLAIETSFDPANDVFLDIAAYDDDPAQLFTDLQPVLTVVDKSARAAVPTDLLRQALGADADQLSDADKRAVGTALITGIGAPRNVTAGADLLEGLASAGDADTALVLANALAESAPPRAYALALIAGKAGTTGAATLMDRLEADIDLATILDAQQSALGDAADTSDIALRLADMRDAAAAYLSGDGRSRSYAEAAFWATLGQAAGDAEAETLLDELDARVALATPADRATWAAVQDQIGARALELWTSQDLPARFGGP